MTLPTKEHAGRIFLIRHGQSEANVNKALLYRQDAFAQHVKLTSHGHEQARLCGTKLAPVLGDSTYAVFQSPYLRARQTWEGIREAISRTPLRVVVDGRLREQEYKDVTTEEELEHKKQRAKERGKLYYRYSNGESGYDVLDRVGNFYNQLRFDIQAGTMPGTILVVCHEVVIRCYLLVALGLDPEAYYDLHFRNCQVVKLEGDERLRFTRASRRQ